MLLLGVKSPLLIRSKLCLRKNLKNMQKRLKRNLFFMEHGRASALGFQKGAEFGYNKANEWHYVKDGDLPKKEGRYYCIIETAIVTGGYKYDIEIKSRGRNVHSKKWYWADYSDPTWYEWELMKVYAWKEIVLPELPKEGEQK